jgi:uncharacterized protein (DUF608 family)
MGEQDTFDKYNAILSQAKGSYDAKLWNGTYYNYDCSKSNYYDSIMSDMCCGHWYLRSSGFTYEVSENIRKMCAGVYRFVNLGHRPWWCGGHFCQKAGKIWKKIISNGRVTQRKFPISTPF